MTVRDDIWQALHDAIGWQLGLADAWPEHSSERAEAIAQVKRYRRILSRRYGSYKTAMDEKMDQATLVSALELPAPAQSTADEGERNDM